MSLYQERNSIGMEKLGEHAGTRTTLKNGEGTWLLLRVTVGPIGSYI